LFEMARVGSGLEWAVILDQFVDATNHRLSCSRGDSTSPPGSTWPHHRTWSVRLR
jgi:hypothetical protein